MITVSAIELFLKSAELLTDGFRLVEILQLDPDGETPASLSFCGIDEEDGCSVDYECIEAYSDGDFPSPLTTDSTAPFIFTFNELVIILNSMHNAIEYGMQCLAEKGISAEERSEISESLKETEGLLNRIDSFLHGMGTI